MTPAQELGFVLGEECQLIDDSGMDCSTEARIGDWVVFHSDDRTDIPKFSFKGETGYAKLITEVAPTSRKEYEKQQEEEKRKMNNELTRDMLKTGMRVVFDDDSVAIILLDTEDGDKVKWLGCSAHGSLESVLNPTNLGGSYSTIPVKVITGKYAYDVLSETVEHSESTIIWEANPPKETVEYNGRTYIKEELDALIEKAEGLTAIDEENV